MAQMGRDALLTLMYELGKHTQRSLGREGFWREMQKDELGTGIDYAKVRAAGPDLLRFCASVVPALVVGAGPRTPRYAELRRARRIGFLRNALGCPEVCVVLEAPGGERRRMRDRHPRPHTADGISAGRLSCRNTMAYVDALLRMPSMRTDADPVLHLLFEVEK